MASVMPIIVILTAGLIVRSSCCRCYVAESNLPYFINSLLFAHHSTLSSFLCILLLCHLSHSVRGSTSLITPWPEKFYLRMHSFNSSTKHIRKVAHSAWTHVICSSRCDWNWKSNASCGREIRASFRSDAHHRLTISLTFSTPPVTLHPPSWFCSFFVMYCVYAWYTQTRDRRIVCSWLKILCLLYQLRVNERDSL